MSLFDRLFGKFHKSDRNQKEVAAPPPAPPSPIQIAIEAGQWDELRKIGKPAVMPIMADVLADFTAPWRQNVPYHGPSGFVGPALQTVAEIGAPEIRLPLMVMASTPSFCPDAVAALETLLGRAAQYVATDHLEAITKLTNLKRVSATSGSHTGLRVTYGEVNSERIRTFAAKELERRKRSAASATSHSATGSSPVGLSQENPLLCAGVTGEHAYLARLRCKNGHAVRFSRSGRTCEAKCADPSSHREEAFRGLALIDLYLVSCDTCSTKWWLFFDMYHPDSFPETTPPGLVRGAGASQR